MFCSQVGSARIGRLRKCAAFLAALCVGLSIGAIGRAADGDDPQPSADSAAAAASAATPEAAPKVDADAQISAFLTAARENKTLDAAKVEAAATAIDSARKDGVEAPAALTEGLATLYPEYQEALVTLAEEKYAPAIEALEKLSAHADPFLAADASYFAARGYISQDRYEEAMPRLETLVSAGASSLQSGNALFFHAVAQAGLLQRQEAIKSFERYLSEYPEAPERMKVGAFRQLQQLKFIEEGALNDVFHRMEFSRRRLSLANTDDQTRGEQDKIVDMLSKLIAQAEEKECNCRGGGKSEGQNEGQGAGGGAKGQGKGKNGQGGNHSANDETVRRVYKQGPQSPWSRLRDKDRDPAFSAIKEKFPARYLELVEQYYKSFQDVDVKE